MARYIDVEIAKDMIYSNMLPSEERDDAMFAIDLAPIADVQEVKHGKWIDTESYTSHYEHIYECSNCHNEVADNFIVKHIYCLHCGAKMDKEKEVAYELKSF